MRSHACALVARCVNSTPCVHVVVPPPPSLPSLSHRRSERPPWVLIMRSGSPGCVWVLCTPRDPALGGHASLVSPWVTLVPVFGCVCVCACSALLCVLGVAPVVPPSNPSAPSLQLVGPLAGAGEQGLRCTVCRLPPAQVLAVCGGAGQEIAGPPPPPPPCRVLSHVRYVHTLERTGNGLS